ncbi:MAG: hypothetical protein BECKG1743D_GA0114223_106391 [Candidatus Kentron sp. G]|nr:MAG: hypothetical protein BECKG1743E_GA0114224_106231 [Candidatus Kentron sp. G]VFN04847.1 MAG: hypothetical protein BECKG1743D_GA0114223_106391 [Candidatus Kentron sp. G]
MGFAHNAYYSIFKHTTDTEREKHLVVERHRPLRRFILWAMLSISFGVLIYFICLFELNTLVTTCFSKNINEKHLQSLNARLTSQNNRLRDNVAILERAAQVEHVAHKEITKTVESLQDELREAKEELIFYRGLIASSAQGKGLTIQSFVLQPGDTGHTYYYRIVLTRFRKDDKVVAGTVDLSVVGEQAGKAARLALSDMMADRHNTLKFRFKNFQKMEGYLALPEEFTPHKAIITVLLKGRKNAQQITKTVNWSSAMD